MMPVHNSPDTADHDVADLAIVPRKEEPVENIVTLPPNQVHMFTVEHN